MDMELKETPPNAENVTVRVSVTFMTKNTQETYDYHAAKVKCESCQHNSALDNAVSKIQDVIMDKYGVQL